MLAAFEMGYNTTNHKLKIGDGVTDWAGLRYTDNDGLDYPPKLVGAHIAEHIYIEDYYNAGAAANEFHGKISDIKLKDCATGIKHIFGLFYNYEVREDFNTYSYLGYKKGVEGVGMVVNGRLTTGSQTQVKFHQQYNPNFMNEGISCLVRHNLKTLVLIVFCDY